MMKCSVGSTRNRRAGSTREAAVAWVVSASPDARTAAALAADSRSRQLTNSPIHQFCRSRSCDIFEEGEVRNRKNVDAGQPALGDRDVRLAPQADVRRVLGDHALDVGV